MALAGTGSSGQLRSVLRGERRVAQVLPGDHRQVGRQFVHLLREVIRVAIQRPDRIRDIGIGRRDDPVIRIFQRKHVNIIVSVQRRLLERGVFQLHRVPYRLDGLDSVRPVRRARSGRAPGKQRRQQDRDQESYASLSHLFFLRRLLYGIFAAMDSRGRFFLTPSSGHSKV